MRSFLQTKDWAEFQQAFGRKIFWIDDKLVVKFDLPLGKSWLYCARPDLKIKNNVDFFIELTKIAQKENAIFCKLESNLLANTKIQDTITKQFSNSNFQNSKQFNNLTIKQCDNLQPQDELVLDISQSEEKLLEQMHQKTRYNLRLAQKKEVIIKKSANPVKDIDIFYTLALQTSDRNKFRYHSKKYYQKMMEVLQNSKELKAELLIAYLKEIPNNNNQISNKSQITNHKSQINQIPIAAIIMLYTKDTGIYLHGASDHKFRQTMAPYLLQWEGIHRSKKRGCKWYNFGGIAPMVQDTITKIQDTNKSQNENKSEIINHKSKISTNHPWSGITRFKTGFAPEGKFLHYPDCYDIVYQPGWNWIYKITKKFK